MELEYQDRARLPASVQGRARGPPRRTGGRNDRLVGHLVCSVADVVESRDGP
jgi:hypothetical protein